MSDAKSFVDELRKKANAENFYDLIVENLKKEAKHLNEKLEKVRNNQDMNNYLATLKSIKETLRLIEEYDWTLKYSEYKTGNEPQIAVWEQNHEGQIRNYKIWTIKEDDGHQPEICKPEFAEQIIDIMVDLIDKRIKNVTDN